MCHSDEYEIVLGRIARTILYKDGEGGLCFCFDLDPTEAQRNDRLTVYLSEGPRIGEVVEGGGFESSKTEFLNPECERAVLAFERVKKWFLERGYQVELDSDVRNSNQ